MSSSQRRIGPYNIGGYGIFTSIINGCNLILSQFLILKVQFNYGLQSFPVLFILFTLINYCFIYPFFIIDILLSLFIFILLSSLSIVLIIFSAYCSISKYSILGSIRLVTQLISFELIWTTLLLITIYYFNSTVLSIYWFYFIINYFNTIYYLIIILLFFIAILADCNRTPFDLPEAESELVAGFITEYSSIYFSIILLTEYGNILVFISLIIILFNITSIYFILLLVIICLIRSSFSRLKFDELMINAWLIILPSIFILLLFLLIHYL